MANRTNQIRQTYIHMHKLTVANRNNILSYPGPGRDARNALPRYAAATQNVGSKIVRGRFGPRAELFLWKMHFSVRNYEGTPKRKLCGGC
jgi:hypothetical protein